MGLSSSWKRHLINWCWTKKGCCWQHVGVVGRSYHAVVHFEFVIGQRAGSGLSVIGSWPQFERRCKTLEFPGSSCWLRPASWLPVRVRGQADPWVTMTGTGLY